MFARIRIFAAVLMLASPLAAQEMTLEDIRIDLTTLAQQLEVLRGELDSTGNSGLTAQEAATALVMIDEIGAEMRTALGRVEALEIRVQRIVGDGTRRIGDMNFRLTELEGGDVTMLVDPVPLGGQTNVEVAELATGERAEFRDAKASLADGDGVSAAMQFGAFVANYPDGPLSAEARFLQGEALLMQGDHQNAARAYLKSFSGAPDSPFAPRSLFGLAISLNVLGQGEQACLTLSEIQVRYPGIDAELSNDVLGQQAAMGCP